MTLERVAGQDAIFLYVDTPSHPMHMGFVGVLDPSTVPGGVTDPREIHLRLVDLMEERLHLFRRLRQRLVETPFRLHHPVFVDDPGFDLGYHVRRVALPAPGGQREVADFAADVLSRPLDRTRPLWEMYVVEGVEGGRWALVSKVHHAIIDGVGGNELLINIMDLEPEPRHVEPPDEPWVPEPIPSEAELLARAVAATAAQPLRMVKAARRTGRTIARLMRGRTGVEDGSPIVPLGPRTVLNEPVGPQRAVAFGRVPLDAIRRTKDALGVKVNDVILAMCGRGLRRYLAARGEEPDRELVAAVPISVRADDDPAGGNRVAGMTVPLADDRDDPAEQLRRIRAATQQQTEVIGAITADLMTDWTEFATPALAVRAFRYYSSANLSRRHPPVANVTISNIPGPDIPLYVAGSRLRSMYPLGPVVPGQALNITVVSFEGTVFVGAVAGRDVVPDVDQVVEEVTKSLAELEQAATA